MSKPSTEQFLAALWQYYDRAGRHDLPWRQPDVAGNFDPYRILVSEVMLQQTQVKRVIPKYYDFLKRFPTLADLAQSKLSDVLIAWSGLGYNRRAKFLWQAARQVENESTAGFPRTVDSLIKLPGVGHNTAGAIMAYAFNQPAIFVETNIRTVYIHHFFQQRTAVTDKQIRELVAKTLDRQPPRSFYWALMDYGSYLKTDVGNLNRSSKSYAKQTAFSGSQRQVRGQVIRRLTQQPANFSELTSFIDDPRLSTVLDDLRREQMIELVAGWYRLG